MPNQHIVPVAAQQIDGLVLDLRRVHRQDGEPSLDLMARRAGYSKSTFHRVLQGKDLPKWEVLRAFLMACQVAESDVDEWKDRWIEIKNLIDPIPEATRTDHVGRRSKVDLATSSQDECCERCGLRIGDPVVHDRWHEVFVPRRDAVRRGLAAVPA